MAFLAYIVLTRSIKMIYKSLSQHKFLEVLSPAVDFKAFFYITNNYIVSQSCKFKLFVYQLSSWQR
jgi:hypothetical protein